MPGISRTSAVVLLANLCRHLDVFCFQVLIGLGCLTFEVFILDYGGQFDCKPVQYMTGGIMGGALFIVLVVAACYRGRERIERELGRVRIPSIYRLMPQVKCT